MKTQRQNHEFGHTQGEIFFLNLQKKSRIVFKGSSETQKTIHFGHQNLEFDHTRGEIFLKTLQKSTLAFNWGSNSEGHPFWW